MTVSEDTRAFDTGATRNTDAGKMDYEGTLSPLALGRYVQYMHEHRYRPDGTIRDADNWQLGMPIDVYMKSLWRHHMDAWCNHRDAPSNEDMEEAL